MAANKTNFVFGTGLQFDLPSALQTHVERANRDVVQNRAK